ncbi:MULTISPECIES: UDP-4-amino-4,6-dideoxy-N-acetyl-beta-L-altrosamine transaminase [Pseudanabaena]|jgi:UDP-4-amino-4,6-dideoxy-N-acetyl-beta-L-altrosamine transaminase|uniref:UDP-4-amino-4, 6-dideoxy-N-acetyl-beta-L-altrosamine transaminase n=1 Tax=Pseudanabaena TaxID=1152 RepID=UPI002479C9DC|nr:MULTISPECIES: UDP-4-amino-4,6-dideoxy-N-acetyl-beta-L-altrosamine transaminase [Pseudanabaena]MEA5487710.1 UDP-4-amino-4,6-dideoxy-N-acetyl-beta-L-altrosamine transaminase [Pseudanabaena sp. CCNP1317]WGS70821.1 UDP-4-amino-4,6-dideoxy-N-acetyl-beta-L-altrosamine transaminase [Pseudanabaena galeata CCNP1313]
MTSYIPYGRQDINQQDIDAVVEILHSDWLTQGKAVERFEQTVADYCGVKYAIAVSSATAALHIACLAIGLGKQDHLWTSPNTFVASANCGLYCGAKVDFVDIDPHTYNLSIDELTHKLNGAEQQGRLPKVLVPVHFAGQSCEMQKISALSQQYGFQVLEDASHAIGGKYQGKAIGCCEFSDLAVFSFHPVKIITTGEGGMVLTNRDDLYEKLIRLRSHGITRNPDLMQGESHGAWYYQQLELGFNYRMTDIQAALGLSQMKRLDEFIARRQFLAQRYNHLLKDLPITLPYQHPDTESSWHLYVIRLHLDKIHKTHRQVFEELRQVGIGVNLHYIPVHTQPYYQSIGFRWGDFPKSETYYASAISIPLYYGLNKENQNRVVDNLRKSLT